MDQPDCGRNQGDRVTDLAEANRILRLGNSLLRSALKTTTDELANWVEHHYRNTKNHPGMFRRYERDMTVVALARAVLDEECKGPSQR
jgi:hypothetical protein